MADVNMDGFEAEVQRRLEVERDAMRAQFQGEWAAAAAAAAQPAADRAAPQPAEQQGAWRAVAKLASPASYDGKKHNLPDFLFKMEMYMAAIGVSEDSEDSVKLAAIYLTDAALTWWMERENRFRKMERGDQGGEPRIRTWAAFCEAIKLQFKMLNKGRWARDMLRGLRQQSSVRDYTQKFQEYMLELPETAEEDRVYSYSAGLKPEIRRQVDVHNPSTLSHAIQIADALDVTFHGFSRLNQNGERRWTPRPTNYYAGPVSMELGAVTATTHKGRGHGYGRGRGRGRAPPAPRPPQQWRDLSKIQCYSCGEKGHMARACPNRRR